MSISSYADEIAATKVMLAGLKSHTEELGKRGITTEFITRFEGIYQEVLALDNEQEALKSRIKEKTAVLGVKSEEMKKLRADSRKLVKMDMPQESWKEFGIEDRQ